MRHLGRERCGEFLRRLADQIRLAQAREEIAQRFDAAGFCPAAGDPENIAEAGERLRGRIGIGGLGIIDEEHRTAPADFFHAMREPGKRAKPRLDRRRRKAERQRRSRRAGGVLRVVQPAQRPDAVEVGDCRSSAAHGAHDPPGFDVEPLGQFAPHGNPHHALARPVEPVGDVPAPCVIDADDRGAILRHAGDEALLDRRVVLHGAVAIEMIFAEIDQDADRGIERRREIDLIGRALDDVNAHRLDPAGARRRQRQDRGADIAAKLRVHCGRSREMGDERRRRRFAVGAGDGDEGRMRRQASALAAKQLDVADHFDPGCSRELGDPVRRRMGERNAGREHKRGDPRPVDVMQIRRRDAGGVGLGDALRIVIEGDDIGAAGEQRACAHQPRAAQPEHRDFFSGKGRDRNHGEATSASRSTVPQARARPRRSRNE